MIGRVVILPNTQQTVSEDGAEIHGVVVDGFILDSIEPRYVVAILEEGQVVDPKKPIDGVEVFAVGTLVCVSHRDLAMAPAPEEMKKAVGDMAHMNRAGRRRTFRDGAWHDA